MIYRYNDKLATQGFTLLKHGKTTESREIFEAVITRDPKSAIGHYGLGRVYVAERLILSGATEYEEAIACDPLCFPAFLCLGNLCFQTRQWSEAIEHYEQVVALDPTRADVYRTIGDAYVELGEHLAALDIYRTAIRIDPTLVAAHVGLGHALCLLEQCQAAEECYRRAIELNPGDVEAYIGLSMSQLGLSMFENNPEFSEKARQTILRALELDKTNSAARCALYMIDDHIWKVDGGRKPGLVHQFLDFLLRWQKRREESKRQKSSNGQ